MINYSAPIAGAINRRTVKSNASLLRVAGVKTGTDAYLVLKQILDEDYIQRLPNYLPPSEIKALKEECKKDFHIWVKDTEAKYTDQYFLRILRKLNDLYNKNEISWEQRSFIGYTVLKIYDWWYPTDQEVAARQEKAHAHPLLYLPPLKTQDEIYHRGHSAQEDLPTVLKEEEEYISKYCLERGWPVISIDWIVQQLQWLREKIESPVYFPGSWDFENELIQQYRRVRAGKPLEKINRILANPKPENFPMSTRGNNYNTSARLRTIMESFGWNDPIPTSLGSIFYYPSKVYPQLKKGEGQIEIPDENFDFYAHGTGKKNGGGDRDYYYTSPQNNMVGESVAKIIIRSQNQNRYCAYRDQKLGQDPLFEAVEAVGIDSTEYSDHQTITILKFSLELYGFGSLSVNLANSLQLPIKISSALGDSYYTPPNGSEAGGRLDVVLINDAGLIISWLIGRWLGKEFDGYVCGDDWTYYFRCHLTEEEFYGMHSMCAVFNQIVNPDKTEWLSRDNYVGFCKVIVTTRNGEIEPATGLPVNLWLKEPSSIRDISQIASSLLKTKSLYWLYPDRQEAQKMLKDLCLLWKTEIEFAERYFKSEGDFDSRLDCALQIPVEYGGLLLENSKINYPVLLNGILNGVNRIIMDYQKLPTKIASFIRSANLDGPFADYLSQEMSSSLHDLLLIVRDIYVVTEQSERDNCYDLGLLRSILTRVQTLAEDYVTNSDGKSRVSTKDRSTPKRDGDCFLDGYSKPRDCSVFNLGKRITLHDLILLDDLNSNSELTSIQKLNFYEAIRAKFDQLRTEGRIRQYAGVGYCYPLDYYALQYRDGRWIRLSQVQNDVPTKNGSYLPLEELEIIDPDLATFVRQCRRLIGEGKLGNSVRTTRKILLKRVIKSIVGKRQQRNIDKRLNRPRETFSPQTIEDQKDVIQDILDDLE